jgi:hypothetical protein
MSEISTIEVDSNPTDLTSSQPEGMPEPLSGRTHENYSREQVGVDFLEMWSMACPICHDLACQGGCQPTTDEDLRAVGAAAGLELGDTGLPEHIDHDDEDYPT